MPAGDLAPAGLVANAPELSAGAELSPDATGIDDEEEIGQQDLFAGRADQKEFKEASRLSATPSAVWWTALGADVGLVGLFLPWVSSPPLTADAFHRDLPWVVTGTELGTTGGSLPHGLIFALGLLTAVALTYLGRGRPAGTAAAGSVVGLVILDFVALRAAVADFGLIDLGLGIYLTTAGGLAATVGAFMSSGANVELETATDTDSSPPKDAEMLASTTAQTDQAEAPLNVATAALN